MTRVCLICDRTSDKPQYVEEINVTDDDKLNSGSGDWGGANAAMTSPRNIAVNFQQDAEQVLVMLFMNKNMLINIINMCFTLRKSLVIFVIYNTIYNCSDV